MSKSLLVVICDFLVLSIISIVDFSQTPDSGKEEKKREEARRSKISPTRKWSIC